VTLMAFAIWEIFQFKSQNTREFTIKEKYSS